MMVPSSTSKNGSFEQFVGQNDGLFPPKLGFAESPDGYLNKEIN